MIGKFNSYCRIVSNRMWFARSSLVLCDKAIIATSHLSHYESMDRPTRLKIFKPPRTDLASRIGKWKSGLVNASQWRTPLVHGRSFLARSDTASIAIPYSPLYESMDRSTRSKIFKPPRADLASRIGKWKSGLVNASQWRTPLVHGRAILARSDTASIVILHSPHYESTCRPPRSSVIRPPWRKWITLIHKWRNVLADKTQWRTPSVPFCDRCARSGTNGWLQKYVSSLNAETHFSLLRWCTPSVQFIDRMEKTMRNHYCRSVIV
jgi:hypothetical protein